MIRNLVFATCAALFASMVSAQASTVTIDFGTHDDPDFNVGEIYSENNYNFTTVSGNQFGIYAGWSSPIGNDPSGLSIGQSGLASIGDTISITALDNQLFEFHSVDYASWKEGQQSSTVKLVGLVNGQIVATFLDLSSNTSAFDTLDPLFSTLIDELQIIVTARGDTLLVLDNFVFSEVPLPAAVWMFLAGLGGLGFARRMNTPVQ